jgi:hypothetical protein
MASPAGPFLNLPRELRDEIYSYTVPSQTTIHFAAPTWKDNAANRFVNVRHESDLEVRYDMSPFSLSILGVCQQIHTEASALLYGTNRFKFCIGRRPTSGYFKGNGPSPFNTVRALPQSAIGQIKICAVRIYMCTFCASLPRARDMSYIKNLLAEMCKLLEKGGLLREMEMQLDHYDYPTFQGLHAPLDVDRFQMVLEPLKVLKGLNSASIRGSITNAYGSELKEIMEGGAVWSQKRRKEEREKDSAIEEEPVDWRKNRNWDF